MPPQPVYCSENNLFRVRAGYDDLKCPPYDSSRAGRGRVGQAGWLLQNFSPPGTFSFACQKRTRKAPATFEAREARTRGCSPLVTPKQLGSIQKIQVAALKDFLCCADFKAPQPLRRQLPAGERGLNITFALSAARMLPQGASAGNTPLTATTPSREKANKPAPQGWLVCNI